MTSAGLAILWQQQPVWGTATTCIGCYVVGIYPGGWGNICPACYAKGVRNAG